MNQLEMMGAGLGFVGPAFQAHTQDGLVWAFGQYGPRYRASLGREALIRQGPSPIPRCAPRELRRLWAHVWTCCVRYHLASFRDFTPEAKRSAGEALAKAWSAYLLAKRAHRKGLAS